MMSTRADGSVTAAVIYTLALDWQSKLLILEEVESTIEWENDRFIWQNNMSVGKSWLWTVSKIMENACVIVN